VLDEYYKKALNAGATGGKLLGAGGGGFFLFYCLPKYQNKVRKALNLRELKFKFEAEGSKIIYIGQ
jgi:D-glycero-alpha-D-manno-heptose-7-phosphate kinase